MQAANNAPIYAACLYPELSEFMRTKGWALAVHGSLARDFDLVAIPWHPDPVAPEKCVEGICHYWAFKSVGEPETRLHGRLIYTIALKFGECFLDLSFMPTTPNVEVTGSPALSASPCGLPGSAANLNGEKHD